MIPSKVSDQLRLDDVVAFDIEAGDLTLPNGSLLKDSALDPHKGWLHGFGVCVEENNCIYNKFDAYNLEFMGVESTENKLVLNEMGFLFKDPKVGHNVNFDRKWLWSVGLQLPPPFYCTAVLFARINENEPIGLKYLAEKYLGKESTKWDREMQRWLDDQNKNRNKKVYKKAFGRGYMAYAPDELVAEYCMEDCNNTYKLLFIGLDTICKRSKTVEKLGYKRTPLDYLLEEAWPIEDVLFHMERRGVRVDTDFLTDTEKKFRTYMNEIKFELNKVSQDYIHQVEEEIHEREVAKRITPKGKENVPWPEFNWGSTAQVGKLFYEKMGLSKYANFKTETGKWKVDEEVLKPLEQHKNNMGDLGKALGLYMDYKKAEKEFNTYIVGIQKRLVDDRIFPYYMQVGREEFKGEGGTVTGRLSMRGLVNLKRDAVND